MKITLPSKTFLLGEYLALKAGPALILTTAPRFQLIVKPIELKQQDSLDLKQNQITGISASSPAGRFITANHDLLQNFTIQFIDPYAGLGGLGASTAQFLAVQTLKNYLTKNKEDDFALLKTYREWAWNNIGFPPSGADLIAQKKGGICYFDQSNFTIKNFSWPFSDLSYALIHTGNKIATHTHIQQLSDFDDAKLRQIMAQGLESFLIKDEKKFIQVIHDYADELKNLGFVAPETQKILHKLLQNKHILAAKGCGAMGADVILIIMEKEQENKVLNELKENGMQVLAHGQAVEDGYIFSEV